MAANMGNTIVFDDELEDEDEEDNDDNDVGANRTEVTGGEIDTKHGLSLLLQS